jgi:cytochrome c oxidase cbb3-type subunit 4
MTIDDLRIAVTLLSLACFAGLFLWTWSARNRRGFDEAARLPFDAEGTDPDRTSDTHRSDAP